jgi:hypothetical protein
MVQQLLTVPDLQDNVAVGKSGTKNVGSTGGANTVSSGGNISGNVGGSTANATLYLQHNLLHTRIQ